MVGASGLLRALKALKSQDSSPRSPGGERERQEDLAAGDYTESDLPVQRVNYSEAEDLKIQLAGANKQTKT